MLRKNKHMMLMLEFLVLILAAIPRGIELLAHNYLFGSDQGLFYQAVKDIVVNQKPALIGAPVGGMGGFFQGPGWYYTLSLPFALMHGDPYGGMILMFLFGIATVYMGIQIGKLFDSWQAGFMCGFLLAVSPAMIPQSRFIWPPFPVSFLATLFLFFFLKTLLGKSKYLPVVFFVLGIMSHFETAVAGTLALQFLLFLPLLFWKKIISLKSLVLSFIALLLTQVPLLIFDLRHDFLNTRGILGMFTNHTSSSIPSDWILNHWSITLDVVRGTFLLGNSIGIALYVFMILVAIHYIVKTKNSFAHKYFLFFLVSSPIVLFLVFLLYRQHIWTWWLIELYTILCIGGGLLLGSLLKHKIARIPLYIILALASVVFIQNTMALYAHDLSDYGGTAKIRGKMDAIDYIYSDANGKPFGLLVFTPPVNTFEYDYVSWWYGEKKYGYLPHKEKKGIVYLLIEKDPDKPWSYNGWLETVIKDGEVTKEVVLQNGFIIQTRQYPN